jgi:hypothetical protein
MFLLSFYGGAHFIPLVVVDFATVPGLTTIIGDRIDLCYTDVRGPGGDNDKRLHHFLLFPIIEGGIRVI